MFSTALSQATYLSHEVNQNKSTGCDLGHVGVRGKGGGQVTNLHCDVMKILPPMDSIAGQMCKK